MKEILVKYARLTEQRLDSIMDGIIPDATHKGCADAMRYSLQGGGKRIRPALVMAFAEMYGSGDKALDPACALEMVHTYSLIHDDLPCMDDDDMRRGRPSCHRQFDEATAVLAGDGLLTHAFDVIACAEGLSFEQRTRLIACLAKAAGNCGMIGGQTEDMKNEQGALDCSELLGMYAKKTGALLSCACEMGCICAERYDMISAARSYGLSLGLAFQIVDDILDITADEKLLGKPVHSDAEQNKATYPAAYGLDAAKQKAKELTNEALEQISRLGGNEFLTELTLSLLDRKY